MPYRRPYLGDFDRARREQPAWPVVVSEGDSWFSYSNVVGMLDDPRGTGDPRDQRAWALLRLERAGDEILTILSGGQKAKLRGIFRRCELDALLFSAGGNDLVGPDLLPLLRPWVDGMSAADLVDERRFGRRLRQIGDGYRELLDLLGDAGQTAPVLIHSYDYVKPSRKGAKLLGVVRVSGPWLLPAFAERGVPAEMRREVVRVLIDGFCATVDQVAAETVGTSPLVRVETRGVVGESFEDEIHPDRAGARRVAKAFERELRTRGVIA
jgi:lysophospholipase L1-like esterase